jgi:hypothetical protein
MGQPENNQIVRLSLSCECSFTHEKLEEMIEMITKMPPEGCSHDRGHKYPFTVTEIFGCEVSQINDFFFTPPPLKGDSSQSKVEETGSLASNSKDSKLGGTAAIKQIMANNDSSGEDEKSNSSSEEEENGGD